MTDILTPFEPAAAGIVPETPAKTKKEKPANGRRKRAVAQVNETPAETPPKRKQRKQRKPRTVPKVRTPRSMKLPVDVMLSALAGLKGDDGALFEKLLGILNAAGKPQRGRVMAALTKVFA